MKDIHKPVVYCVFSVIVWISVVYQFVRIAKYIDITGERISDILGPYGIYSAWLGLIVLTVQMFMSVFDMISAIRRKNSLGED